MDIFEKILVGFFIVIFVVASSTLLLLITIPIWSDSKEVCEYWEKQNNEMTCIKETRFYCLSRNCDWED